jgi:hypothetical protein
MSHTYLCRHYKARRRRIYRDITGHQTNVPEFCEHLTVLLIAQSLLGFQLSFRDYILKAVAHLDRTSVNNTLFVLQALCDSIFRDDCLSSARMR